MNKSQKIKMILEEAGCTGVKPKGTGWRCCCPYHDEKTPSFDMNEDGLFHCFGCKVGGGLLKFLKDHLSLNFKNAKKYLDSLKIEFDPVELKNVFTDYDKAHSDQEKPPMRESILGMYDYCPQYMLDRGFDKHILRNFEVGFNFENGRVTIPLRDVNGNLVGISERSTDRRESVKYIHPPIYTDHLWALHRFKGEPVLPIFEGQLKCLWAWQTYGVPSITTMSSNVTMTQGRILAGFPDTWFILFFDGDKAGVQGTLRAITTLNGLGLGAKLRVAYPYPAGVSQPDDLAAEDFFRMLDNPLTPFDFYEKALLDGYVN